MTSELPGGSGASASRAASAFLQRLSEFRFALARAGIRPITIPVGDSSREGDEENAQIEIDLREARDGLRPDRAQKIEPPNSQDAASRRAGQRKQNAFGKHLPKELNPASAQGETNREFAFPRSARPAAWWWDCAGDQPRPSPPLREESSRRPHPPMTKSCRLISSSLCRCSACRAEPIRGARGHVEADRLTKNELESRGSRSYGVIGRLKRVSQSLRRRRRRT